MQFQFKIPNGTTDLDLRLSEILGLCTVSKHLRELKLTTFLN